MSSRSKQKGDRAEYKVRDWFISMDFKSRRVPLSGALGGDLAGDVSVKGLLNRELIAEVKSRSNKNCFWKTIKKFLADHDFLFLYEDRTDPLVVMPVHLLEEIIRSNNERQSK